MQKIVTMAIITKDRTIKLTIYHKNCGRHGKKSAFKRLKTIVKLPCKDLSNQNGITNTSTLQECVENIVSGIKIKNNLNHVKKSTYTDMCKNTMLKYEK